MQGQQDTCLELYGQAVAVPPRHIHGPPALHQLELDDDVLQHLCIMHTESGSEPMDPAAQAEQSPGPGREQRCRLP